MLKRLFLFFLALVLCLGLGGIFAFQAAIRLTPGDTFTKEGIQRILANESTVFYNDGKTKVGVFFEGQHRDYVPYDSIPKALIDALVAAEDARYFEHGGMDVKAFAYAMWDNLRSGSLRRGGSTLTQQTAKNLFKRRGRTVRGKVVELVNAYRLERNFTKQEILEFYLNQFYVSGNGHGVRIAARYFFDKELKDLSLVECAFIAGSVKGPNQYNPFLAATPEKKKKVLEKGRNRVAYVLRQMRRQGKIPAETYEKARQVPLAFKKGDFRFSLSTNMVKVQNLLESVPFQEILAAYEAENFMGEGLQIHTTLDPVIQRGAEYAAYHNLSRLEILFSGYQRPKDTVSSLVSHFTPGGFYTGRVCSLAVDAGGAVSAVQVRFGVTKAWVDREGVEELLRAWNLHLTGAAGLPAVATRNALLRSALAVGQPVFCSVPFRHDIADYEPGAPVKLRIENRPVIQGGLQVLRGGKVLANVGGFMNTGYDRVNQAKRQFGSTFKPFVYAAALELGWKPLDPLPNARQLFRLGSVFYFPKPDHAPEDTVSIAWAARRSENLASVHLLYHLFDKTPSAEFWEAGRLAGFAPESFGGQEGFERFVRDSLGLVMNAERFRELRYENVIADIATDLTFAGRVREAEALRSLPYGLGFAREQARHAGAGDRESQIRFRLLGRSFLQLLPKAKAWSDRDFPEGRPVVARHRSSGALGYFGATPDSAWEAVSNPFGGFIGLFQNWQSPDSVLVEGAVSIGTLKTVEQRLAESEQEAPEEGRYSPDLLFNSREFRAGAAIRYILWFSRRLGITSPLDPVISYPLGVNSITLGEAVNAYQALKEGMAYKTRTQGHQLFIERITLRDGTVIFEDEAQGEKVIREETRAGMESILATVVEGGTGRQISRDLVLSTAASRKLPRGFEASRHFQAAIPAFGKTGTTNDYRNGAFLGYMAAPSPDAMGFEAAPGYALGVYVGFDDNRPMVHKGFRGTGSAVAIPPWIETARQIGLAQQFPEALAALGAESLRNGRAPRANPDAYVPVQVSKRTGLPLREGTDALSFDGFFTEDLSDEFNAGMEPEASPEGTFLLLRRE